MIIIALWIIKQNYFGSMPNTPNYKYMTQQKLTRKEGTNGLEAWCIQDYRL